MVAMGYSIDDIKKFSHVVAVHFTVDSTFVVWDDELPEGLQLTPSSLTMKVSWRIFDSAESGGEDEDTESSASGGDGESTSDDYDRVIQLWLGKKYVCEAGNNDLVGSENWCDNSMTRLTIQKLVDAEARNTAAVRRALPRRPSVRGTIWNLRHDGGYF